MEAVAVIREKIDYKKTKLNDRKQVVEEILNKTQDDLINYFDDSFKASLNTKDKLSHEDSVCRTLESLANYLLNSDEVKQQKADEEFKYQFHTDEQYFKMKINRENSIESMSDGTNEDTVIHFLVRSKKNYKKGKVQAITSGDLKRNDFLGDVLRQYNDELEKISEKLKKGANSSGKRYLLTRASGQIKTDMILVKDQLLGVFGYNTNAAESTEYNLELVDLTNAEHIEVLLNTFCDFDPNSELAYLIMAFEELAEEADLTEHERNVYRLVRQGMKKVELAPVLNVSTQQCGRLVRIIANKIAKKASEIKEKYDI